MAYDPELGQLVQNTRQGYETANTVKNPFLKEYYRNQAAEPLIDRMMMSDEQKAINDQVSAYREMTEITKAEIARKRGEEVTEKRRIEEKQIRALRRNNRSQGLLGVSSDQNQNAKLGG